MNIQMLSFSLTDMLVGFSAMAAILGYHVPSAFTRYAACAGLFYGYCVAQTANLFHAFGICLHRIITIKGCAGQRETTPNSVLKTLLFHLSVIWTVSLFIVSIPFGVYGQFDKQLSECSLNSLFGEKYINFLTAMGCIFIVPQMGMNVVYIYMLKFLFNTWKNINSKQKRFPGLTMLSSNNYNNLDTPPCVDDTMPNNQTKSTTDLNFIRTEVQPQAGETTDKRIDTIKHYIVIGDPDVNDKQKLTISHPSYSLTEYEETYRELCRLDIIEYATGNICDSQGDPAGTIYIHEIENEHIFDNIPNPVSVINKDAYKNNEATSGHKVLSKSRKTFAKLKRRASKHRHNKKLRYGRQKHVLVTIGMILIAVNVCITPLTFLSLIELLSGGLLAREVKFLFMALALINSGLNPIIYSLRIRPFRHAFTRNWNTLFSRCSSLCI